MTASPFFEIYFAFYAEMAINLSELIQADATAAGDARTAGSAVALFEPGAGCGPAFGGCGEL